MMLATVSVSATNVVTSRSASDEKSLKIKRIEAHRMKITLDNTGTILLYLSSWTFNDDFIASLLSTISYLLCFSYNRYSRLNNSYANIP